MVQELLLEIGRLDIIVRTESLTAKVDELEDRFPRVGFRSLLLSRGSVEVVGEAKLALPAIKNADDLNVGEVV